MPSFAAAIANVPVSDPRTVYRINFIGPAGSFLTIPSDALAAIGDAGVDIAGDNPLRGSTVLVGGTFAEGRDVHRTPYGLMPGVEIQANIVHMLATGSLVRPAGWLAGFTVQLVAVFLAGLVMVAMRPLWGTAVCLAGALLLGVPASYLAFSRGGYWVDFLLPVAVTSLLGVGADVLSKRRLRDALGRYVSPEVAARVERNPGDLEGERRQVSILFTDLRGFTTLSERMAPEQMAARLTEYFDAMTSAIFVRRGMVNDFIGDAILAVFGAPLDDPEHARHAILSALAMSETLGKLNERWSSEGLPPLRMGVGIHTGEVFAGNVGRAGKVKYAVVGDTVNLASRVEGLNKEMGTTMLVTEATYRAAGLDLEVKDRGLVSVKGREEPVRVYEVIGLPVAGPGGATACDDSEAHGPRGRDRSGLGGLRARRGPGRSADRDPRRARAGRGEAGGGDTVDGCAASARPAPRRPASRHGGSARRPRLHGWTRRAGRVGGELPVHGPAAGRGRRR